MTDAMDERYDLCIIGGGAAGLEAARTASVIEARVALIEDRAFGGSCTWSCCLPGNALLKSAVTADCVRKSDKYGIHTGKMEVDFPHVMERVRSVMHECASSGDDIRRMGIHVYKGRARFIDAETVRIESGEIKAGKFLICTGAHPRKPEIAGLEEGRYCTYETIWSNDRRPEHLIVIGGGVTGVEMAQAFSKLGARVTILTDTDRILPGDEPEVSETVARIFNESGIVIRIRTPVEMVRRDKKGFHVQAGGEEITGDMVLAAVGRVPSIRDLNLEGVGIAFDEKGIRVNDYLQTSRDSIFACGDCTHREQYAHYAQWQARIAVQNALLNRRFPGVKATVPWAVNIIPEVAHAGYTEHQAKVRFLTGIETRVLSLPRTECGIIGGDTGGFIKVVYREDESILGVTIVSERAREMIQEWIEAIETGKKLGDVGETMHLYTSWSMANQKIAYQVAMEKMLEKTPSGKFTRETAPV